MRHFDLKYLKKMGFQIENPFLDLCLFHYCLTYVATQVPDPPISGVVFS